MTGRHTHHGSGEVGVHGRGHAISISHALILHHLLLDLELALHALLAVQEEGVNARLHNGGSVVSHGRWVVCCWKNRGRLVVSAK